MPLWASSPPFTRVELQWSSYVAGGLWVLAGALVTVLAALSGEPGWTV
jgi:hypothetical protein